MSAAIIQVESENFSPSLLAIQDEPLAEMVIQGCQQFARIVPYAVELRKRFKSQPRGKANIAGCQTWEEFCEKRLDRGVRAIQIAIKTYRQRASLTEGMPCPSGKKRYDSVEAARAEDDSASARIYNCRQCRGIHFDTRQTNTAAPVACVCPDCGESFESKRKLKAHAFTVHKIAPSEVASFLHRAVEPPPSEPVEPVDAEFIDMPAERTTVPALTATPVAALTSPEELAGLFDFTDTDWVSVDKNKRWAKVDPHEPERAYSLWLGKLSPEHIVAIARVLKASGILPPPPPTAPEPEPPSSPEPRTNLSTEPESLPMRISREFSQQEFREWTEKYVRDVLYKPRTTWAWAEDGTFFTHPPLTITEKAFMAASFLKVGDVPTFALSHKEPPSSHEPQSVAPEPAESANDDPFDSAMDDLFQRRVQREHELTGQRKEQLSAAQKHDQECETANEESHLCDDLIDRFNVEDRVWLDAETLRIHAEHGRHFKIWELQSRWRMTKRRDAIKRVSLMLGVTQKVASTMTFAADVVAKIEAQVGSESPTEPSSPDFLSKLEPESDTSDTETREQEQARLRREYDESPLPEVPA